MRPADRALIEHCSLKTRLSFRAIARELSISDWQFARSRANSTAIRGR